MMPSIFTAMDTQAENRFRLQPDELRIGQLKNQEVASLSVTEEAPKFLTQCNSKP